MDYTKLVATRTQWGVLASNKTLSDKYNEGGKIINFKKKRTKENKEKQQKKTKMYAEERTKQRTKQGLADIYTQRGK